MKNEKRKMKNYTWLQGLKEVMSHEFRAIFRDSGAMLLLVFALLIYATIYSLAYAPEVVRNVPIGVIDISHTPSSRALTDMFDAGANTYVAYAPADMAEAKRLFFERKIYGIVYIPSDFERRIAGGGQAVVAIYCDAGYFLIYRQVFQELVASIQTAGARVEVGRLLARGVGQPEMSAAVQPVDYSSHNLFNPSLGYGSFVMPPILMVIIQQTLLVGIGIIGGTWRERHLYRRLMSHNDRMISPLTVLVGRMAVYCAVYAVTTSYILMVHYRLFGYPMNGRGWDVALFVGLYILCCAAFALAVSTLFRRRESSLLLLLWSSIPLLMLSGVSFPKEGIPEWLNALALAFPSTHGVEGFVRIQTMGATLSDVAPQICWLAALLLLFAMLFMFQMRRLRRCFANGA